MEEMIRQVIAESEKISDWLLFVAMVLGSAIEYVFPPVPGDLWTAGGAILIAHGKSFWAVFLGVNLGSLLGFLIDYRFGVWLARPERRFRTWGPRWERFGRGIDRVAKGFERHTAFYLVINRFLPSVRAFFFVTAGYARVPLWKVIVYGLASAVVWNLLFIGAGYLVGRNLDRLLAWLHTYNIIAWSVLGAVAVALLVRYLMKRSGSAGKE